MKHYLPIVLAIACAALVVSLVVIKRGDNAQHDSDAAAINDFSNQLDSAQTEVAFCKGTLLTLSNSLNQSQSASLTFSNQLTAAESNLAVAAGQITNLTQQVAAVESENQTNGGRIMDLTNQMAGLTTQIGLATASLGQANTNYALLENRLRRDVAERTVVERKFNNPSELQAQLQYLRKHPAEEVSADGILAGLDVEVKSNVFHVIAPN
jgi:chromosome segregation ATPase